MSWRLLINGTILNNPYPTGLGVYTANLLIPLIKRVCNNDEIREVALIGLSSRLTERLESAVEEPKVRIIECPSIGAISRIIRLNLTSFKERRKGQCLFYSPTHHGVRTSGMTQIITIHDLFARLFPLNYRAQHLYFKYYLPGVLRRCHRVICVSDSTAHDLHSFYPYSPETITVYESVRSDLEGIEPKPFPSLSGKPYFLFVGPNYWYKNGERLIDAYRKYRQQGHDGLLVFAGGRDPYTHLLQSHIRNGCPGLAGDIIFLGYVNAPELVWLYKHATALMLTTLYEGFGLPALEAMKLGCPVVASKTGSLPEVCGNAAAFINPYQSDDITAAMVRISSETGFRGDLIYRGGVNCRRFSWDTAAEQVYQVITEAGQIL